MTGCFDFATMKIMVRVFIQSGLMRFFILLIIPVIMIGTAGCEEESSTEVQPEESTPAIPIPEVDLTWNRVEIPEDENAYSIWLKATEAYVELSDPNTLKIIKGYDYWETPNESQLQELQTWVKNNTEALREFDKGLSKTKCQVPLITSVGEEVPKDISIFTKGLWKLTYLKYAKAILLVTDKQSDLALREILGVIRIGEMIFAGDGYLNHVITGTMVHRKGFRALFWLLEQGNIAADELLDAEKELCLYTTLRHDLAQSYKADYHYAINHVKSGWAEKAALKYVDLLPVSVRKNYQFDTKYVLLLLKDYFSFAVHKITKSWEADLLFKDTAPGRVLYRFQQKRMELKEDELIRKPHFIELMSIYFLHGMLEAGYTSAFEKEAERAIIRTILLLEAYQKTHGQLPETLQEVVDADLVEELPIDPFTEEPILYSRERKIVWSTGPDGVNHDGLEGGTWYVGSDEPGDIVWKLPGFERMKEKEGETYGGYGSGNYYVPGKKKGDKLEDLKNQDGKK